MTFVSSQSLHCRQRRPIPLPPLNRGMAPRPHKSFLSRGNSIPQTVLSFRLLPLLPRHTVHLPWSARTGPPSFDRRVGRTLLLPYSSSRSFQSSKSWNHRVVTGEYLSVSRLSQDPHKDGGISNLPPPVRVGTNSYPVPVDTRSERVSSGKETGVSRPMLSVPWDDFTTSSR